MPETSTRLNQITMRLVIASHTINSPEKKSCTQFTSLEHLGIRSRGPQGPDQFYFWDSPAACSFP